ncbi:MAG: ABC transporter substrate-binding protein, partial [Candidatus Thorarchaeota archaeon]
MDKGRSLLSLILLTIIVMGLATTQGAFIVAQDSLYTGPFVDKVVYNVIEQDDQQVLALQNDEVDLIGDWVDPTFLPTLTQAENIEVSETLRNGYGYIAINCAKYPFNITAFRRAAAFAYNKTEVTIDVWD